MTCTFSTIGVVIVFVIVLMTEPIQCMMTCNNGMFPVYSFATSGGDGDGNTREYHVKCCESGVSGDSCDPPVPGLDFMVRCTSIFPLLPTNSSCNCGQDCVGMVIDNSICFGACTCTGTACRLTTASPTKAPTSVPTNSPTKSPTNVPTNSPTEETTIPTKELTSWSIEELMEEESEDPIIPVLTKGEEVVISIGVVFGFIMMIIILYNIFVYRQQVPVEKVGKKKKSHSVRKRQK